MSTEKKKPDQNRSRLDLEIDSSKAKLDSVIDETVGPPNAFESIIDASQNYLHDMQDGEQDKSDEHYQEIGSRFLLDSTETLIEGDLTDQMKDRESSTDKPEVPLPAPPPAEPPPIKLPPIEPPPIKLPPIKQPPIKQPPIKQPPIKQPPIKQPPIKQPDDFKIASATSDFGTGGLVNIQFLAQGDHAAGNDIEVVVSKSDHSNASGPTIVVELYGTTVSVDLNTNAGNETTAALLMDAINNHAGASALIRASLLKGDGATDITVAAIDYSPIALLHLEKKTIKPPVEPVEANTSVGEWSLCASLVFIAAYLVVVMFWALGHPVWETIVSFDTEVYRSEFPIGVATIILLISVLSAFCSYISIFADKNNRRTLLVRLLTVGPAIPTYVSYCMIWVIIQRGAGNSILESFLG